MWSGVCRKRHLKFSQACKLQQLKWNLPSAFLTTGSVAFLERYFSWTILSRPHFLTVPFNSLQWGQIVIFLALSKICLWRAFRTKYGNPGFITFILSDFLSLSGRRTREHDCKRHQTLTKIYGVKSLFYVSTTASHFPSGSVCYTPSHSVTDAVGSL